MRTIATTALLTAALILAAGSGAKAQGLGQAGTQPGMLNAYASAAQNPYLNTIMTAQSTTSRDTMMYLWAAQTAGQTVAGATARGATPRTRAAEMPRTAMVPGGSASRYFSRNTVAPAGGTASYYGRSSRYFGNNGR